MNRLKGHRFYLSGAIDRVKDAGIPWREDISKWMQKKGICPVNPHEKPFRLGFDDEDCVHSGTGRPAVRLRSDKSGNHSGKDDHQGCWRRGGYH